MKNVYIKHKACLIRIPYYLEIKVPKNWKDKDESIKSITDFIEGFLEKEFEYLEESISNLAGCAGLETQWWQEPTELYVKGKGWTK